MGSQQQDDAPVYQLGKLGTRFVVAWWENGKRRRFRFRKGITAAEARAELTTFIKTRERVAAREATTVAAVFQAYLRDREIDGKSIEKQRHSWKALAPYFGTLAPSDIDKALCREFQKDRRRAGRAIGTVWTDLSVLRAALNWGRKTKLIPAAPFIWLPPQPKPRDRHLTRPEAERLIGGAHAAHIRLFVRLALGTAARATALLDLEWNRVDFDRRMVDLRTSEENETKRRAVVPINATLVAALREAKKSALTPYVIEYAGKRLKTVKRAFARAAERAGLEDVSPNVLRHTAAVWMAEAGVPIPEIAQYLGHTNPAITYRVYARYSPDHLRRASDALELPPVQRVKR